MRIKPMLQEGTYMQDWDVILPWLFKIDPVLPETLDHPMCNKLPPLKEGAEMDTKLSPLEPVSLQSPSLQFPL